VRRWNSSPVTSPESQPSTAATMMIQISDTWLEPTTQLIFALRVLATISATRTTKNAASRKAHA